MATVVMCDRRGCPNKAFVHLEEVNTPYTYGMFGIDGKDYCMECLEGWHYTGSNNWEFHNELRDPD